METARELENARHIDATKGVSVADVKNFSIS